MTRTIPLLFYHLMDYFPLSLPHSISLSLHSSSVTRPNIGGFCQNCLCSCLPSDDGKMQCRAVQKIAVQSSVVSYRTVQCRVVQCRTFHYSVVLYITMHCIAVQGSTRKSSKILFLVIQCRTMQYNSVRYRAMQCSSSQCSDC